MEVAAGREMLLHFQRDCFSSKASKCFIGVAHAILYNSPVLLCPSPPAPAILPLSFCSFTPPSLFLLLYPPLSLVRAVWFTFVCDSILCDCEIALVIFNSQGKLTQYASGNIDQTLSRFIDEKPMESWTNDSYGVCLFLSLCVYLLYGLSRDFSVRLSLSVSLSRR